MHQITPIALTTALVLWEFPLDISASFRQMLVFLCGSEAALRGVLKPMRDRTMRASSWAQQPGTPEPPGTPPQPPRDPTAPRPYEEPPRPIPIPRRMSRRRSTTRRHAAIIGIDEARRPRSRRIGLLSRCRGHVAGYTRNDRTARRHPIIAGRACRG